MLAGRGAATLAATYNPTLPVDHFLQQFDVFVIDVHGSRSVTIDENRVFFLGAGANSRTFSRSIPRAHWTWRHGFVDPGEWSRTVGGITGDSPKLGRRESMAGEFVACKGIFIADKPDLDRDLPFRWA